MTVSKEICQKLPEQPKQTEHVLQNDNKIQDMSHVTKVAGINLDNEKAEQLKAEIEANSSFPNNKKTEQPRTEIEMNSSAKSTQFMLSEKTIQKEIALNTQEIWQKNHYIMIYQWLQC
ncbi:8190_t:CDS:2 [Cetraspora pellucida]|uniref:8190_t:CDS:1 n=1 Tax=Cetraspora pellucida TaxID=1433469 RepID=A0A9N9NIT3_9GLOM|nr:8190_t:CDS:2 [Cetraspora pellucida]